jgi:hypothetical protein
MSDPSIPEAIRRLADARADARASRDFATADRLKADIEAAGWRVVDRGFSYRLALAHPPDLEVDGLVLHGQVVHVPSRLDAPPTLAATVVIVAAGRDPSGALATLQSLRRHAGAGQEAVVVVDGAMGREDALRSVMGAAAAQPAELPAEVTATSAPLGDAAALSIGIRQARGAVVIVVGAGVEVEGDIVGPLTGALADPTIAVVGAEGLVTLDLHRFELATPSDARAEGMALPAGLRDADAITETVMAFRRSDAAARGPLDERLRTRRGVAIWWSLVLRDMGDASAPRRAAWIPDLPVAGIVPPGAEPPRDEADGVGPAADERRRQKRDTYRISDRFGHRRDLAST